MERGGWLYDYYGGIHPPGEWKKEGGGIYFLNSAGEWYNAANLKGYYIINVGVFNRDFEITVVRR